MRWTVLLLLPLVLLQGRELLAEEPQSRIAVFPVQTKGLSARGREVLLDILSASLRDLPSRPEVLLLAPDQSEVELLYDCKLEELSCLGRLAEEAGSNHLARLSVEHEGPIHRLELLSMKILPFPRIKRLKRDISTTEAGLATILPRIVLEHFGEETPGPLETGEAGGDSAWMWGFSISSVGLLATGGAFGWMTRDTKEDFDHSTDRDEAESLAGRGRSYALTANICFGLAALSGAAAMWLFLRDDEPSTSPPVRPAPGGLTIVF